MNIYIIIINNISLFNEHINQKKFYPWMRITVTKRVLNSQETNRDVTSKEDMPINPRKDNYLSSTNMCIINTWLVKDKLIHFFHYQWDLEKMLDKDAESFFFHTASDVSLDLATFFLYSSFRVFHKHNFKYINKILF